MTKNPNSSTNSPYFAAIDLGSNSFHMLIVKVSDGVLETVDRVKEMVQIARGLQKKQTLSDAAKDRALHCLSCFHERIRDIPPQQIRVVGTKALRSAKNATQFLEEAEAALGFPIDIISGYEEGRLVYLGATRDISPDKGKSLVIDIGGGSTEFIIGQGNKPKLIESLSIGCVTFSDRYFADGDGSLPDTITEKMIKETYYAACVELELITRSYRKKGWDIAVGTSGTMRAIAEMMPDDVVSGIITREGLNQVRDQLRQKGGLIEYGSISNQRLSVLPAGIIILSAIFDQLKLDELHVVNATLKEGLIYDTLGRLSSQDMRDHTVGKFMEQYQIDKDQAHRVHRTLQHLVTTLPAPIVNGVNIQKILHWASLLHEVGLSISHSGYHHHGAYLLKHSDMAGFSRFEQELLALFVGSHRRKIHSERLAILKAETQQTLAAFFVCLRLSVLLNHRREDDIELPEFRLEKQTISLRFDKSWMDEHPLTLRNLQQEKRYLKSLNIQLEF